MENQECMNGWKGWNLGYAHIRTPHSTRGRDRHTHFRVFSFLSRDLACCSLMMVAFTCGGFMCTLSFPPTSRRTVAANLVWVFRT